MNKNLEETFFKPEAEKYRMNRERVHKWFDTLAVAGGLILSFYGIMLVLFKPAMDLPEKPVVYFGLMMTMFGVWILNRRRET